MKRNQGFTLVELLVVSPIILVVAIATITFLFNQYGNLVRQNVQLNLQLEAQNILFGLQDDLWFANQFSSDMNANLQDPYAPVGGWSSSTTPATLILSDAALDKNRRDTNRQPVYINGGSCSPPDGNGANDVLYNNEVYFLNSGTLYKRILSAPASLPTCSTPYVTQTCPADHASASCLPDKILSTHVDSWSITYYAADNTVTSSPESADSVKVNINLKDKGYGEDVTANSSLRLKKLNG